MKKAARNMCSGVTSCNCSVFVAASMIAAGFSVAVIAADTRDRRRATPKRLPATEKYRAAAPATWDRMVSEAFLPDAFSVMGERPTREDFGREQAPPAPRPPTEFDRSALMKSLHTTEETIARSIADEKSFRHNASLLQEQLETIGDIAAKLKEADPEHKDDEDYQRLVEAMSDSAAAMQTAVGKLGYEASGRSFGKLRQSCDSCHQRFR